MGAPEEKAEIPELKQAGWKIPEPLRRRLNSHAEYLSIEKETKTEEMIAPWLEERLAIEERRRSLRTLGIDEDDLSKMGKGSRPA